MKIKMNIKNNSFFVHDFDLMIKVIDDKLKKQRRRTIKVNELEKLLKDVKSEIELNKIEFVRPKKNRSVCKRPLSLYNMFIKSYIKENNNSNISQQDILKQGAKIWSSHDRNSLLIQYNINFT